MILELQGNQHRVGEGAWVDNSPTLNLFLGQFLNGLKVLYKTQNSLGDLESRNFRLSRLDLSPDTFTVSVEALLIDGEILLETSTLTVTMARARLTELNPAMSACLEAIELEVSRAHSPND